MYIHSGYTLIRPASLNRGEKIPIQSLSSNESLSVMMMWKWTMGHIWKPVRRFLPIATNLSAHRTQECLLQLWQQKSWCSLLPFSIKPHPLWAGWALQGTQYHCYRTFWTSRASVTTARCPTRRQHTSHPNISTRHFWQLCTQERGTRMTQTLGMQSFSPSSSSPSESPNTSSSYLKISLWT